MQRGAIKQHGKFWVLKYREVVIKDGVRVRKDSYKKLAPIDRDHQTKASVQAIADLTLAPLNAGTSAPLSADSLLSYLERFLANGEGGSGHKLADATVGAYQDSFKVLLPHLPDMQLRQIRTPDVDKLLARVAEADGEDRRARTSYRNMRNFLSSAFKYAVRKGLMDFNPARDVAVPEGKESDTYAYSLAEVKTMVDSLMKPIAQASIMVATFTGLRVEEIKGLRWEDYDAKEGTLNIKRAFVEGKIVETKTKASKAAVPVIGIVKKVLAAHLKLNSGDGFIFHGDTGEPLRMENMARRDIIPMLERTGVEWHGFHAFRRGLASTLHDLAVPELTIKHILRHSDSDVTRKHYIKASLKVSRQALEQVEKQYLKLERTRKRKR
jgi:integrase